MNRENQSFKEKIITAVFSRFPLLAERWAKSFEAVRSETIPWTPFTGELSKCRVAIITTAGVHLKSQPPFDMEDEDGDYSFREIPGDVDTGDLMITHKYYDHSDADRDMNIVFPVDRLRELAVKGEIGGLALNHFGVMGHITGHHVRSLIEKSAPQIAAKLREDGADIALMTPG